MNGRNNRLIDVLNSNVPFAPASADEVRERLNLANPDQRPVRGHNAHEATTIESEDSSSDIEMRSGTESASPVSPEHGPEGRHPAPFFYGDTSHSEAFPQQRDTRSSDQDLRIEERRIEEVLERAHRESTELLARYQRAEEALTGRVTLKSDKHGWITVSVDIFGNLVEIEILPDAKILGSRLGDHLTQLIDEAQEVAERLYSKHMREQVPGWDEVPSVQEVIEFPNEPIDFDSVEHAGSWQGQNAITEALEAQYYVAQKLAELGFQFIQQELPNRAGSVHCNILDNKMRIDISADAMDALGCGRLSAEIVKAVGLAGDTAAQERSTALTTVAKAKLRNVDWI